MSDDCEQRRESWRKKLNSDSSDDRIDALRQISSLESIHGLTARIVELAGSTDDEVRMWAAEAMESAVQPDAGEQLTLIQLLESTHDSEVCYWAATMLGRLGTEAVAAATALSACVRQSMYLPARERATWALSQIGEAAEVAIPTLNEVTQKAPPRLQRMAVETLKRIQGGQAGEKSKRNRAEEAA